MKKIQSLELSQSFLTNELVQVFLGFVILFASSQLVIDIKPVPITMQTVGVMLLGLIYSPRAAFLSLISWLALGAFGAPVFANMRSGITGASAGYLVGMLAAAPLMSMLRQRLFKNNSLLSISVNCTIGTFIIFIFGLGWLAYLTDATSALKFGLFPFILPGFAKILILSASIKFIRLDRS